jgi:hypothetical protein
MANLFLKVSKIPLLDSPAQKNSKNRNQRLLDFHKKNLKPSEEEVINKIKEPPNTGFEA